MNWRIDVTNKIEGINLKEILNVLAECGRQICFGLTKNLHRTKKGKHFWGFFWQTVVIIIMINSEIKSPLAMCSIKYGFLLKCNVWTFSRLKMHLTRQSSRGSFTVYTLGQWASLMQVYLLPSWLVWGRHQVYCAFSYAQTTHKLV